VPKPSALLAESLGSKFRSIEHTRVNLEGLARRGLLSQRAATQVYEGMFLSASVTFEGFLEQLFVGLLLQNQGVESQRSDIVPRILVRSHRVARELLFTRQRQYVDWLPYDRTIELAKKYFRGGRPFSDLSEPERQHISKCHTIRNVIAHNSRDSQARFEKRVLGTTPLPPHERTVAGYLRGLYRIAPAQTRYENLVAQLLTIARKLAR
jgi:hypothetical protein